MASQTAPASTASRYLFVLLAGVLIGLVATVMAMRALQARQDPFPRALMQTMDKQLALLQRSRTQNRCSAADLQARVQTLRLLGNDLETAFPDLGDDSRFQQHAGALRATLDAAQAPLPATCAALDQLTRRIDDSCDACHRDFR
ncbi:cytochrome c556 [Xanthomonas translucens]